MSQTQIIQHPIVLKKYLNELISTTLFNKLLKLEWNNGIKTKYGTFTRKAYRVDFDTPLYNYINQYINDIVETYNLGNVAGFYLNLYENGEMYTPTHKHESNQIIISLGVSRTLIINSKKYLCQNGDILIFGNQKHGVPKEIGLKGIRISIASFCF